MDLYRCCTAFVMPETEDHRVQPPNAEALGAKDLEAEAAAVLADIGLTLSDAYWLLLCHLAEHKRLPFEGRIPNSATIEAIQEADQGDLPEFETVEALFDDLNADD